ncbi:hypothetical protein IKG33_01640 [Candidatus Saccharibacteria bacterium]|nr:hypothetical protein [Candidatus Saccharibacteria bacterium]
MRNIEKFEKRNRRWVLIGSIVFALIAIVLWIALLSPRKVETGERKTEISKVESMACEGSDTIYPYFQFDNSTRRNLKVVATIEDNKIRSITLQYMLYYNDSELIKRSETENHAAMNLAFAKKDVDGTKMNATYAKLSDAFRFGIYKTTEEMTTAERDFFLLDGVEGDDIAILSQRYNQLGMNCTVAR